MLLLNKMSVINSWTYFLDSKYRNSGINGQPTWDLPNGLMLSDPANYFAVQILSIELPFSFYTLDTPNNTVGYTLVTSGDSTINITGTLTITPGAYNITQLLAELSTRITGILTAAGMPTIELPTFAFTYSAQTGKATLGFGALPITNTLSFTLDWANSDILAEYFGFYFDTNTVLSYSSPGSITSTNYISPNNVNCNPITSLALRSNTLNQTTNNIECLVEQRMSQSDILLKIPIQVPSNSWIFYENNSNFSVDLRNQSIDQIQLYLTHLTYDPVYLDGVHWKIVLKIEERQSDMVRQLEQDRKQEMTLTKRKFDKLSLHRQELATQLEGQIKKIKTRTAPQTIEE
jgi:hypothetical protein